MRYKGVFVDFSYFVVLRNSALFVKMLLRIHSSQRQQTVDLIALNQCKKRKTSSFRAKHSLFFCARFTGARFDAWFDARFAPPLCNGAILLKFCLVLWPWPTPCNALHILCASYKGLCPLLLLSVYNATYGCGSFEAKRAKIWFLLKCNFFTCVSTRKRGFLQNLCANWRTKHIISKKPTRDVCARPKHASLKEFRVFGRPNKQRKLLNWWLLWPHGFGAPHSKDNFQSHTSARSRARANKFPSFEIFCRRKNKRKRCI